MVCIYKPYAPNDIYMCMPCLLDNEPPSIIMLILLNEYTLIMLMLQDNDWQVNGRCLAGAWQVLGIIIQVH